MSKVRCSNCGATFSSHRTNCPECGNLRNKGGARIKPGTGSPNVLRLALIVVLILAIIFCVVMLVKLVFFRSSSNADSSVTTTSDVSDESSENVSDENSDEDLGLPSVIDVDGINGESSETESSETAENSATVTETTTEDQKDTETAETVTDIKLNTLYDDANGTYDSSFSKGESFQFKATTTPSGADVTWSIEDTSVGQIDENGNFTAVGSGKTTMTVTAGGHTVSCIIRVN